MRMSVSDKSRDVDCGCSWLGVVANDGETSYASNLKAEMDLASPLLSLSVT